MKGEIKMKMLKAILCAAMALLIAASLMTAAFAAADTTPSATAPTDRAATPATATPAVTGSQNPSTGAANTAIPGAVALMAMAAVAITLAGKKK
jgi:glucose/arabinose dehydrogenase